MSSKKAHRFSGTLSFRLTVWYAVIFTLTSFVALFLFYSRISTVTMENTDNALREEVHEFLLFMRTGGLDQVLAQLDFEAEEEGGHVFFRMLTSDGQVVKALHMDFFEPVGISEIALEKLKDGAGQIMETVQLPNHEYGIRIIYARLAPELIFNMGISLEENYEYLMIFRNLIFWLLIPLFLFAAVIGWLLARHAMKGVEEVTGTANQIAKGSIEKRVEVRRRSREIDQLANTFNAMLDRIQELIKSIREMNDNIAHDLRSPLTRIRGIAEMTLIREESIEEYREMAVNTIEECDKLIGIINTMLYITETEAGVHSTETRPIDVVPLILSACELFDPIAQEKNVQLITALPESIVIRSDKTSLQRLVTNLLENAIKYNRQGGTVTISAAKEENRIQLRFEDTGIGIPESDLSKIFERFYRCDANRSEPGTGLGLSLARAISRSLRGDIRVVSIVNQGSTFSVTLPA